MRPAVAKRLRDVLESARLIRHWAEGLTYDAYVSDPMLRSAVERRLTIIGEALNHARRGEPDIVAGLPNLHEWVAQRNFIIHVYAEVSDDLVWDTLVREIPVLIEHIEALLATNGPGEDR